MRRFGVAAILVAMVQSASAADLPILRGSYTEPSFRSSRNWEGFYVGGQAGYGVTDSDFTNSTKDLTAKMLANTTIENQFSISSWPLMSSASNHNKAFGGFVGYNMQWENAVVGVEANYMHGSFGASSSGAMSRSLVASDGYTYGVTSASTGSMMLNDFGSVRVRGGYVWGDALPYAFVGVGLGRGTFNQTSHVYGVAVNSSAQPGFTNIPFDYFATDNKNNRLLFGYSVGVGLDYMLLGGLFVRAEWEYTQFQAPVDTIVNTVRGGVGYKF